VDERKKQAYRYLLYWAMLEIRGLAWLCGGWNPFGWRRARRRVRCAGAIADWLHNLALYSSVDFRGFNEEWFWRDFESIRSDYPEFGLERYRNLFDERIAAAPEHDVGG
jgi:hypothetical protein